MKRLPALAHFGLCCLLLPVAGRTQTAPPPPAIPIGMVQGTPSDDMDPILFASPYNGQVVTVEGVVHGLLTRYNRQGRTEYGFFLQNREETDDDDPATSDGLFVYTQRNRRAQREDGEPYVPTVGDEIRITGKIREIMNVTQLTAVRVQEVLRQGVDIDRTLRVDPVLPGDAPAAAARFWEGHEGMRVRLPAGCLVLEGRQVFNEYQDAEFRVMLPDAVPARRTAPYHRRVFRDPHPLDDIPERLFDNDNAYRILLGSLALKGATHNARALLPPVRTFDTLAAPVAGPVNQRYEAYSLQPDRPTTVETGPSPALNGRIAPLPPSAHFTVASFNVENLYDHRNDPTDNCDDAADPGSPWVSKPFNYLPTGQDAYEARLAEIAIQIARGLNAPDLLLLQEVEDQDILRVDNGDLVPAGGGGDGELDVLQDLARRIREIGGPAYASAVDRDAADQRGIICAFLYRPERVELVRTDAGHFLFGSSAALGYRGEDAPGNRDVGNPKAFNARLPADVEVGDDMSGDLVFARAPLLGRFRLRADGTELYVVNNHLSSRPDQRIAHRKEQAAVNARIVRQILAAHPRAAVVVGGDLNTFPRPDDPTPLTPQDQLGALYEAGLHNLYDDLLAARPEAAYTYVYQGQAQTLDQIFVSPALHARLAQVQAVHLNSDFPADWPDDSPYGASDHDPVVAAFTLQAPPPPNEPAGTRPPDVE